MFVDLIDRLRCPNDHADTWLVAAASRTVHRHLLDATLGCVECGAEFEIKDGDVWFGTSVEAQGMAVSEEETLRAAALLKLEERGLFLLEGGWASFAHALPQLLDVDILLSDPPAGITEAGVGQGTLRGVGDRWPLAAASLHGLALSRITPARAADAVRVLRPSGRLVAPIDTPLPAGVRELARDDRHWVAEKVGDVIPLARARR